MIVNTSSLQESFEMDFSRDFSRYVNHEVSVNLESSNAFEGPEKLLEIWFAPSPDCLPFGMPENGLRAVPRTKWEEILDHVQCKVLSVVSNSEVDSFVLSESSMFVYPNRVTLKTCGTTTLLMGIPHLLKVIESCCGYSCAKQPWRVFYSRKCFMFPEKQKHPHHSWKSEVHSLNGMFGNGRAYVVGDITADHWYLYTTSPTQSVVDFPWPRSLLNSQKTFADENLEVLMTDLAEENTKCFFADRLPGVEQLEEDANRHRYTSEYGAPADDEDPGHVLGNIVTKTAGIDSIYPTNQQVIDSFCFAPCGYSCNGIVSEKDYFTIHVTPESHCSYASFETTVDSTTYGQTQLQTVKKVTDIFKPGRFSVVYFKSHLYESSSGIGESLDEEFTNKILFPGYKCVDKIIQDLKGYYLVFASFEAINR